MFFYSHSGWVALGSNYNDLAVSFQDGIQGCVSQAMVWNRALTVEENIRLTANPPVGASNPNTYAALVDDELVQDWARWDLWPGAQKKTPSMAGKYLPPITSDGE